MSRMAPWSNTRISTSTTTNVKASPGILHSVVVCTKGAAASVVTVYDNPSAASGTVLAVIDSLNQVGTYTFDLQATLGITVVTTGAPDIVVLYK